MGTDLPPELRLPEPIYVTRPTMPDLGAYVEELEQIWDSRWLANQGEFHERLERRLAEYLGQEHISLFCNGTIALLVALQSLRLNSGQVITTPFTFPATPHVLFWNRIEPVFCDIDPVTMNLDPNRIEGLIGPDTRAILPVHVFGQPCDIDAIQEIAARHGLQVIYDAAHAFGVDRDGESIIGAGDVSMMSFHATKLFTCTEGGALACRSAEVKQRVDSLKNFGIADEETVIGPGINGKMNEISAAFGLLHLEMVEAEIERRGTIARHYDEVLGGIPGVLPSTSVEGVRPNHSYYPVRIRESEFGSSRNELHEVLCECNIITRKYFHPLASRYACYASLPSAAPEALPVAEVVASEILCLPIYGDMSAQTVEKVCEVIRWVNSGGGNGGTP